MAKVYTATLGLSSGLFAATAAQRPRVLTACIVYLFMYMTKMLT